MAAAVGPRAICRQSRGLWSCGVGTRTMRRHSGQGVCLPASVPSTSNSWSHQLHVTLIGAAGFLGAETVSPAAMVSEPPTPSAASARLSRSGFLGSCTGATARLAGTITTCLQYGQRPRLPANSSRTVKLLLQCEQVKRIGIAVDPYLGTSGFPWLSRIACICFHCNNFGQLSQQVADFRTSNARRPAISAAPNALLH
ncbi:hypothetical protein HRbin36_02831 [bacterium HR36]|nr:hypothetical protein HRbin36_02831 [bacterium HR36]